MATAVLDFEVVAVVSGDFDWAEESLRFLSLLALLAEIIAEFCAIAKPRLCDGLVLAAIYYRAFC